MPKFQIVGRTHRSKWERQLANYKRLAKTSEMTYWRIRTARQFKLTYNPLEAAMSKILRELGIKFKRQACFTRYFVDFWLPQYRIAIETDGASHNTPKQVAHDEKRDRFLSSQGVKVCRFLSTQVFHTPSAVKAELKRLCGLNVAPAQAIRP